MYLYRIVGTMMTIKQLQYYWIEQNTMYEFILSQVARRLTVLIGDIM